MKPATTSVTVVFVGQFAPASLLLPSLVEHKAIGKIDAEQSSYEALLRDEIVDLKLPWGRLICLRDRLTLETSLAPYVRIIDLAAKCIREVAGGSLVTKVGINVTCQYGYTSMQDRDALGQRLVPLSAWGSWGEAVRSTLGSNSPKVHGGLLRATVRQPREDPMLGGHFDLLVEAAGSKDGFFNVLFRSNDHFEPSEGSPQLEGFSARMISEMLTAAAEVRFDTSVKNSLSIIDSVVNG